MIRLADSDSNSSSSIAPTVGVAFSVADGEEYSRLPRLKRAASIDRRYHSVQLWIATRDAAANVGPYKRVTRAKRVSSSMSSVTCAATNNCHNCTAVEAPNISG